MKLTPPAVKVEALSRGLEVYQPAKVKDGTLEAWMRERRADVALVIAYGRILTTETLAAPRLGCVNLHASLLPHYRGAAPIQRAIMAGESETGVCLMQMDEGMDTGPVLSRRSIPIESEDDSGSLALKLGQLAATITKEDLPLFLEGHLHPSPQEHELASYAPPLTKDDSLIDFSRPAQLVRAQIRGLAPRPGAVCFTEKDGGKRLKLTKVREVSASLGLAPGQVRVVDEEFVVGTLEGALEVLEAQIEGKKSQPGSLLARGRAVVDGQFLYGKVASLS